jgi:hypothetical protein
MKIIHSVCEPAPPSVAQTAGPSDVSRAHKSTTEYQPNNEKAPVTQVLDEHGCEWQLSNPSPYTEAWRPFFKTREDFELAKIIKESGMSEDQCDRLLKIFRRCMEGKGRVTLKSYEDARSAWYRAFSQPIPVSPGTASKF